MGCIEISCGNTFSASAFLINRNMGCIEIYAHQHDSHMPCAINRNMGCIEIIFCCIDHHYHAAINRNMGCIEMYITNNIYDAVTRLIETWDVLKSGPCLSMFDTVMD